MTSSKPGSTAYARFIPREEMPAFAAWKPDAFGAAGVAAAAAAAAAAPPPPPTAEQWAARVQAARQQGYQDGYRDGLVALEAFKQQHDAQTGMQFAQIVARLDAQWDAHEKAMADAVTRTAVQLARQVVRAELLAHPQQVARVAQEAVNAIVVTARHLRLKVHPGDHAHVLAGAAEALEARGVRLLGDAAVEPGGCVLESDLGQIDARIGSRWAQAAAVYGRDDAWDAPDAPEAASA